MPSPSAISKFVLDTLKFFKHTQFLKYTQNVFDILKSDILLYKLDRLSVLNPIPNRLGHVIYNERADSALTW